MNMNKRKLKKSSQKEENNNYRNETKNNDFKRCTFGANFIIQFGVCQHPVHQKCVKEMQFTCPIDRSIKNCLLPSIETIPKTVIFKDLNTLELNLDDNEDSLSFNVINSIDSFVEKFASFFKYLKRFPSLGIQIELIKSISALISTYEIRLRSLPDCLDSEKTEILARNLFLTVWYWYRINGKPINLKTVEIDSKLTLFQRFIKKLIECDEIDSNKEFVNIVSLFVNELSKSGSEEEKKLCLFLRRVCLAENFLLGVDVRSNKLHDIIYWDDVLSPFNLSEHEKSASFL